MWFSLLIACNNDFGLAAATKPSPPADTATEEPLDSAAPEDTSPPADTSAETTVDTTPPEETTPPEDTATTDPAPQDDCVDTDDLVYVLSRDDSRIYTFDPTSLSFNAIGKVSCPTSQSPGSMSVSRDGYAYIRYADNSLYAVELATMNCQKTSYSDKTTRFDSFGMGYATDNAHTWRDHLYVANDKTLGVLDTNTWKIKSLGTLPSQSELTGNAAGELWAMLPLERPAELVRVDVSSGNTVETLKLPKFPDPSNIDTFAFATWSGDFYVFVREYGMGNTTNVYKVDRSGAMSTILKDIGFDVVGAGVSTCAPEQ